MRPFKYEKDEMWEAWARVASNTCNALGIESGMIPRTAHDKVYRELKYFKADTVKLIKKLV